MKKISAAKATHSLADYARKLNGAALVVTDAGKPIAALVPIEDMDMETLAVGTSPSFSISSSAPDVARKPKAA